MFIQQSILKTKMLYDRLQCLLNKRLTLQKVKCYLVKFIISPSIDITQFTSGGVEKVTFKIST